MRDNSDDAVLKRPPPRDACGAQSSGASLVLPPVPDLLGKDVASETNWQGPADALLSLQGKPATDVWTCEEWMKLALHLHNGNEARRFIMGFRKDGVKQYVRAKTLGIKKAISWAWGTIGGRSKSGLAFVPFCSNSERLSRWGAVDFDAHDGDHKRARCLAFSAFRRLLDSELFLILESSGGGWHVWAISKDFHPVNDWIRLLKQVASSIKAPIKPGVCEIFPPDTICHGLGKGLRAPGSWNPGTETLNEIYWENTERLLESLPSVPTSRCGRLTDIERNCSFSSSFSTAATNPPPGLYREWERNWAERFSITSPSTRNNQLAGLVGEMFHQVGREMASRIVEAQFCSKTVKTNSNQEEHLESFKLLWQGLHAKWVATLSGSEQQALRALQTENERDAFRIMLSYRRKAEGDGEPDFAIAVENLGERLGITTQGASKLRQRFVSGRVIELTQVYQPNKRAARFRWALREQPSGAESVDPNTPF